MDAATKKKAIDDAAAAATAAAHAATVEVIDVNVDALLCNWCNWCQLPDLTARMPVLLFTTTTPIHFAASVVEIVLNSHAHACLQMY